MSKFCKKPISLADLVVELKDETSLSYKGKNASGIYKVPHYFFIEIIDGFAYIRLKKGFEKIKKIEALWGLNKALLNNALTGARNLFEKKIKIEGLGFKVQQKENNLTFFLGFSHKKEYVVPSGVSIEIDKSGQNITLKSHDKLILGDVSSAIRSLRPPENYKGKGIRYENEVVLIKPGKAKS